MREHFKIHNKLIRKIALDNLRVFGVIIIFLPIYYKWRNGTDFIYNEIWLWMFLGFIALLNIPVLIIYLNYYFENKNTIFTLDNEKEKIIITHCGIKKAYLKSEIKKSIYHLGIYYKNALDRGSRMPMLISDFGYWELEFENGDRYYLTNILHDFIHDTPKVANTKYRFRFYPYIKRNDSKQAIDLDKIKVKN